MTSPPVHSRILIIEDNPQMAEILALGLGREDLQAESVSNGQEALAWMRQQKYDLIILDLGLPGLDGTEVLRQIKTDHASAHIPVIVMTGRHEKTDKHLAFELGAADYVTKPFDMVELQARLQAVLRTKRLQDELTQANEQLKSKAEFLAKTSHEIRTQLGAVSSLTSLLLQTELTPQQRDYAETVFASGESLLTLLNDILNISKIESGKLELERRPFHLRLCIDEALGLLAARCAEKNLDLLCDFDDGIPEEVIGDLTRLRQVLFNLISNAVKFTDSGEVVLGVRARLLAAPPDAGTGGTPLWEFQFSVRDTGIGIPASRLGRLFQSFSQVDSSISREYGGSGLGLFISKGLVELMGGKLWAESTQGFGSTFHFTATLPAAPGAVPAAWQNPQPQLAGRRLLVVDDNATCGRLIARQTQRWGLVARAVESAWQALEWLRIDRNFDLILIDAHMPKMDGLALAREIRKNPLLHKVSIILLVAIGTRTNAPEMAGAGVHLHLTKPLKPALLHAALLRALAGESKAEPRPEPAKSIAVPKLDSSFAARVPLRILLTDDNVINQKVAGKMLSQLGYQPDIASNGAEALAALQRQPYDVILMDVQMPGMDGLEASRRIRALEKQTGRAPVRIIAMTANAMAGDREKCLAAGMDEYLTKPVRPDALQKMLEASRRDPAPGLPAPVPAAAALLPNAPVVLQGGPKIDMHRLMEFAGGSEESLVEIIDLYLNQTKGQIEQMRAELARQNKGELARLAHTCAGASAICGIESLVPLIRDLEARCKNGGAAEAPSVLDKIVAEFDRVSAFLLRTRNRTTSAQAMPA